jgi:multiple sugar transport system permease protein
VKAFSRRRGGPGSGRRAGLDPVARHEERVAYLFLSPWLIGLLLFSVGPIIASFFLSLTDWNLLEPPNFVGTDNYKELFTEDPNFAQAVKVTLKFTLFSVPLYMVAGLAMSLLLNLRYRGMNVFRTILFVPSVLSGVAVAILWASLLNPDVGAVNWVLREIGIERPPQWLRDPTWAVPSVVLIGLWGVGGNAIIYLAGLQNIPSQLYEAIELDGAGPWQRFRYVTFPMLTPTLLFVLLTSLITAFQVFDTAFILGGSSGGIGDSLRFYLIELWNEGFRSGRFGYASALAWLLVVFAALVILAVFRTSGRWVYYENDPDKV